MLNDAAEAEQVDEREELRAEAHAQGGEDVWQAERQAACWGRRGAEAAQEEQGSEERQEDAREAGGQEAKEESPSPQERGPARPSAAQPGPEPALPLPVLFFHLPDTYDISRTRLPG